MAFWGLASFDNQRNLFVRKQDNGKKGEKINTWD
jgi:hypothetical protein